MFRSRLALLSLLLLPLPSLAAQDPVVLGGEGRRLDSLLRRAEADGFHGAVLVARRGTPLLLQGYGLARHTPDTPFGPATLVQIGSNVKDFTATAIHQLAERGRLRLTDSLHRYFPDLPADRRAITLRDLLDHRSGLPLGVAPDSEALTRDEMLRRLRTLELAAAPGSAEIYSNLGYSLLAAIVEQVEGLPFEAYLARYVFAPAGMRETGLALPGFDRRRVAHGYAGGRDRGTVLDLPRDADGHLWSLRGNGGMLSTLGDMHRFYQALRGPGLLRSPEHRRAVVPLDEPGVWAGSDRVSYFAYASFPGADAEIIVASNHQEYPGSRVLRELQAALGIPLPEERERVVTGPTLDRIPDTGVGRTVAAFLEAYHTGDTAVMRRFLEERGQAGPETPAMPVRLQRFLQMRADVGDLTIRGVRESPAGEGLVLQAAGSAGQPLTLTVAVDSMPPHRLRGVRVEVGS